MNNILIGLSTALAIICLILFIDNGHLNSSLKTANNQIAVLSNQITIQNLAVKKLKEAEQLHQKNLNIALAKSTALEKHTLTVSNKIMTKNISSNCESSIVWGAQFGAKLSKWTNS